jgi:hypothetical protein
MSRYILIRRLRGPAFVLLVGFIALMAQAHIMSWGRSWPLFLILAGVLALAERAALAAEGYPQYPGGAPYDPNQYPAGQYPPGQYPPGQYPNTPPYPGAPTAPAAGPTQSVSSTSIVPVNPDDYDRGSHGGQS